MTTAVIESRLDALASCEAPFLIGVRHHSALLASKMPELLDAFAPERVCIELPQEFESWVEWMAHADAEMPLALAASGPSLFFYPLADFSPELAAIRWCYENEVQLRFIDLPLANRAHELRGPIDSTEDAYGQRAAVPPSQPQAAHLPWIEALRRRTGYSDTESLWERLVEAPGLESSADSIRRAALLFGRIVRDDHVKISQYDRLREAWMRRCLAESKARSVAVVGAFHAEALAPEYKDEFFDDLVAKELGEEKADETSDWQTALIPYSFAQLDSRSGYPAGVLDPVWHQSVWESRSADERLKQIKEFLVEICRDLRTRGTNASTADAISAFSMAQDLSRLRNLAAPGRTELHESLTSTLVQGEQIGRRRQVAAASRRTMIGHRMGSLPTEAPRSGMVPHIEGLIEQLRLPGPKTATEKPKRIRLDVLRNNLDRARSVTLQRMSLLQIPYGKRIDSAQGPRQNLTEHWEIDWTHATTAKIYTLSTQGVDLPQAVTAAIRRWNQQEDDFEEPSPDVILQQLVVAARCGIGSVVNDAALTINQTFAQQANLTQVVHAANWYRRIANGLVPGLPLDEEQCRPPIVVRFEPHRLTDRRPLLETAIARLEGILGSDNADDCRSVFELASWIESGEGDWPQDGGLRFRDWLHRAATEGSPLLQGVSVGCQINLDMMDVEAVDRLTTSWWDHANTLAGREDLARRIDGWLFAAGVRVTSQLEWLAGVVHCVAEATDDEFLKRLLPLHQGFKALGAKQRKQLLDSLLTRLPDGAAGSGARLPIPNDPVKLADNRKKDQIARAEIARVLPGLEVRKIDPQSFTLSDDRFKFSEQVLVEHELSAADRWHLILGGKPNSPKSRSVRSTYGDLLGDGDAGGAGDDLVESKERTGGDEAPEVDSRKWAVQLERLLGSEIAEEVLLTAAARGRLAAFQVVNPNRTPSSPDLLRRILSMYSQADSELLQRLKVIAKNISERLAKMLAVRLQPKLTGLMTTRPRNRPSPALDLPRTLRRNLKHTYVNSEGQRKLVAARPVFRTPATRNMDWSIHLVVDVSGSMETSTVYAALVASVFAALPAVDLQFITFSTEVADLSNFVDDPLALLTEVRIGGGTHIALGLRAAREAIRVPNRAMVVLITDFHEGVSVPELLGEVRSLATSGAKLIGLAALDDKAKTVYHTGIAQQCVAAGMPVAALSPEKLAAWVAEQIRNG